MFGLISWYHQWMLPPYYHKNRSVSPSMILPMLLRRWRINDPFWRQVGSLLILHDIHLVNFHWLCVCQEVETLHSLWLWNFPVGFDSFFFCCFFASYCCWLSLRVLLVSLILYTCFWQSGILQRLKSLFSWTKQNS